MKYFLLISLLWSGALYATDAQKDAQPEEEHLQPGTWEYDRAMSMELFNDLMRVLSEAHARGEQSTSEPPQSEE